ncbi:MAG: hypothetical protein ACYDAG_04820 [Chloroflexota bacterium]
MPNISFIQERRALLALELMALGVDVRRLGFLRWLIDHGDDPEWYGHPLGLARIEREHRFPRAGLAR